MFARTHILRCTGYVQARGIITAAAVKDLRLKSGAPMMDCKKALQAEEVNGDIKLAMDWLRAKGIARALSQTNRESKEGLIATNLHPSGTVTLLEVNCETGQWL